MGFANSFGAAGQMVQGQSKFHFRNEELASPRPFRDVPVVAESRIE